jgi:hypothetical protein
MPLVPFTAAILALIGGAMVAAFIGATLGAYLSKTHRTDHPGLTGRD